MRAPGPGAEAQHVDEIVGLFGRERQRAALREIVFEKDAGRREVGAGRDGFIMRSRHVTNAVAVANGLRRVSRRAFAQETSMRSFRFASPAALGAALIVSGFVASPALAADAAHPTVIELFQSQGCSSCPPANASLIQFSQRSDVLALNFAVTYWDRLGWKDTFATPQYTQRQ